MKILSAVLLILSFTSGAQAAVLQSYDSGTATPETLGGYTMTDFGVTGGTTSSITSSNISGTLNFVDINGDATDMLRTTANSTSWWDNGETTDNDIFLTGLNLVTILLPENTRAFSFNVGAALSSTRTNAWLSAIESTGSGVAKTWFNVSSTNTPGFGIYADNSNGGCSSLTSVTIDPVFWGFGNFSINQSSCASVPESSSIYLLAIGLLGLLFVARRKI